MTYRPPAVKASNLLRWWPLNGTPNDLTGTENGTVSGPVYDRAGYFDKCYSFAGGGADDTIDFTGQPCADQGNTGAFTIAGWMNLDTINAPQKFYGEASTGTPGGPDDISCGISGGNAASIRVDGAAAGDSSSATGTTTVAAGEWHHVTGTYNNDDTEIFLDGVSEATATGNVDVLTGISKSAIGGRPGSSVDHDVDGAIQDVMIWDTELTAGEIKAQCQFLQPMCSYM